METVIHFIYFTLFYFYSTNIKASKLHKVNNACVPIFRTSQCCTV